MAKACSGNSPTATPRQHQFATNPSLTIESLRELRFSEAGGLLAGWNRLHLHVWDAYSGERLWHTSLIQRAVSAHYSIDMTLQVTPDGQRQSHIALPLLTEDVRSPSAWVYVALMYYRPA